MSKWHPSQLSHDYMRRAEEAKRRANECKQSIKRAPTYKVFHDEALAEFYVYDRLFKRIFVNTPQSLIAELQSMKNLKFKAAEALDYERFERCRIRLIDELLNQIRPLAHSDGQIEP